MEEDHEEVEDEEEEEKKPAKMKNCPLKKFDGKDKKADEMKKMKQETRPAAAPAGRTEDSDMMTGFTAQLLSQVAKMETIMVSTLREKNKTINDRIDDTNSTLREGFKDQDEKHVIFSHKLDVQANQMHEKFTKLTERLDALERDTGSVTPPVRAGGASAELPSLGSARGSDLGPGPGRDPKGPGRVDPLQTNEAWADFRRSRAGLGTSPLGASPARRPSSSLEPERDFVADHLAGRADTADERVFVVRRVAADGGPDDAGAGDGEEEEDADVEVGDLHRHGHAGGAPGAWDHRIPMV